METENIILIDWFAASFFDYTVSSIIELLSFKQDVVFMEAPGRYFYRDRVSYCGINIYYNNKNKDVPGVLLEMSGKGCRTFETLSNITFEHLFAMCSSNTDVKISRLDVAYDDRAADEESGLLNIRQILSDTHEFNYVSRWDSYTITDSASKRNVKKLNRDKKDVHAYSVLFGSKSSEMYCRFYDKAMERGGINSHWVRCELVMKHERALSFILDSRDIGVKMRGVLANYLNFIIPDDKCTNVTRLKLRKYWVRFLGAVEKIRLYTPKDENYNSLARAVSFLEKQAGNSFAMLVACYGLPYVLSLIKKRSSKFNPLQRHLIFNYGKYSDKAIDDINYFASAEFALISSDGSDQSVEQVEYINV